MAPDISNRTVTIYVRLLDEGTPTSRPTNAVKVGVESFRLLATPNYDPEDEHWEFPPGSVVRCEATEYDGKPYLLAVALSSALERSTD
jgi:hypothetical protein